MSTEVSGSSSGRPRWLKVLLIASLALNLLVIGGMASAMWRHHHGRGPFGGPRGDHSLMGFVRELPSERQQAVRAGVEAAREAVKPMRQEIRDAWAAANTVLTAEPFDKTKVKEAAAKLLAAEAKFKTAISDALIDTAEKLTPEERKKLQEWRERRRGGHHRWRDRWRGGPDGGEPPN